MSIFEVRGVVVHRFIKQVSAETLEDAIEQARIDAARGNGRGIEMSDDAFRCKVTDADETGEVFWYAGQLFRDEDGWLGLAEQDGEFNE